MSELPDWFVGYRDGQLETTAKIVAALETNDLVILDAPTGSGKTLIAESVRRLRRVSQTRYICSTKTLQDQFLRDFDYAAVLKGRNNYPTLFTGLGLTTQPTAADCTASEDTNCFWCGVKWACPYEIAKKEALHSELAVLNTSYFLTECNGPGRFAGAPFVIVDEADTLENELMGFVSVEVSQRRVEQFGLGEPDKVTKPEAWAEWVERALPKVKKAMFELPDEPSVQQIREHKYVNGLYGKLKELATGLTEGEWVYTGKEGVVSFKPVRVDGVGQRFLWGHGKKWLLMSASIISPHEMVESLGYKGTWQFVEMGSSFPVQNRQVKVIPIANMSKKADEKERCSQGVNALLARHPNDRVLVHTVSYDLAKHLASTITDRTVITYTKAEDRERALSRFKKQANSVLVASSMDRGIDLPDDLCRVVIVAKIPFPYLGDRQVNARIHSYNGQMWYNVQTVRTLIQMTGRATRHKEDWSVCYIVDSMFTGILWGKAQSLFPSWWKDALDWRDNIRIA